MGYAKVSWQPDDDITSQKLQQMCDNIDSVNARTPAQMVVRYQYGTSGGSSNLRGRTPGTVSATTIIGGFVSYDYDNTDSAWFQFFVYWPPGQWTAPPIVSAIVATGATGPNDFQVAMVTQDYALDHTAIAVTYLDKQPRQFHGVIHLVAIGY